MAETNGLLNRRTGKSGTEGSNPSVSASTLPDPRDFAQTARAHRRANPVFGNFEQDNHRNGRFCW